MTSARRHSTSLCAGFPVLVLGTLLLTASTTHQAQATEAVITEPRREVVITIDDLPIIRGSDSLDAATTTTRALLAALTRHQVPALGFVIGDRTLVPGQVDARLDLLRLWLEAGSDLGNHSFSHPSFNTTDLIEYQDDVVHGDLLPRFLMAEQKRTMRYFRHPYNQTGPDAAVQAAFRAFMAARDVIIAPFTVEHADYLFNSLWLEARDSGDTALADKIRQAYVEQLDSAFDFAESLSDETFSGAIPQIFLIHANELNALCLDEMLERLSRRGYRFITMDEALRHPAYATEDRYVGGNGISWLHRWRQSMGLPDRLHQEPDPPMWLLEAWEARRQLAAAR